MDDDEFGDNAEIQRQRNVDAVLVFEGNLRDVESKCFCPDSFSLVGT